MIMIFKNKQCSLFSVVLLVLALLQHLGSMAQQEVQFTNYMYSTQVVNPAYAGSKGILEAVGIYRNQWVGVDGAPETVSFFMHGPVGISRKVGLGLSFASDKIGPSDESYITSDFSYSVHFERSVLSFGLKGGLSIVNIDYGRLNIRNPGDTDFQYNVEGRVSPIVGAGIYLHNDRNWYVGVSAPTLIQATHYNDVLVANVSNDIVYYGMAGFVLKLSNRFSLKPAVLGRVVEGAPIGVDLSANVFFDSKLALGASYRFDAGLSNLLFLQITPRVAFGYAYDYGIGDDRVFSKGGTHEVFLRFFLGSNIEDLRVPREY